MAITLLIVSVSFWCIQSLWCEPVKNEISTAAQKIEQQKHRYIKYRAQSAKVSMLGKELKALENSITTVRQHLPDATSMSSMIDAVYRLAERNQITFTQFTPENPIEKTHYLVKPIQFKATASFKSIAAFVEKITNQPQLMQIANLHLVTHSAYQGYENEPLSIQGELRAYLAKPVAQ